jgi:hypothetical protein
LQVVAAQHKLQILLVQEPYAARGKVIGYTDPIRVVTGAPLGTNPCAAILVTDPCLDVTLLGGISTSHTV